MVLLVPERLEAERGVQVVGKPFGSCPRTARPASITRPIKTVQPARAKSG